MEELDKPGQPVSDEVGYGHPPKHTRFKPGRSGNPRGRPKGTMNVATILARTLRQRVVINENGKRTAVSKLEAAITQVTNKAASGDLKALHLLAGLVRTAEESTRQEATLDADLDEYDEKVVLGILKRLEATEKEGQEDAKNPAK